MSTIINDRLLSWENYLGYGKREYFKQKSIIFEKGMIGTGFFYVKKGLIKIVSMHSNKNERILDIVRPGNLIGLQAIDNLPYNATAISHVDSVLYYFTKDNYEEITKKNPDAIILLTHSLFVKEKLLLNNINATSSDSHYQIAYCLIYLMNCHNSKEINLTQRELALYVGLTRVTIYKVLKLWTYEGVLSIKKRKIYINDPSALKRKMLN